MLAARATASFILSNESNMAILKHFSDLLPGVLQVSNKYMPQITSIKYVYFT